MNLIKSMTNDSMINRVTFPEQLVIDYNLIKNKKIFKSKIDFKNKNIFIFNKYIPVDLINYKFGLDGISLILNDIVIINNNDKYNLIKASNYSNYYNWIIDNLFKLVVYIKYNYGQSSILSYVKKNFEIIDIVRDNYLIYWTDLIEKIDVKNEMYYCIKHMINNCNDNINFQYILDKLYIILWGRSEYYGIATSYNISYDNKYLSMFGGFYHLVTYIIYLGFRNIIKEIDNK